MMAEKYITFAVPIEPQDSIYKIKVHPIYNTQKDFGLHDKNNYHVFTNFLWYGVQLPQHPFLKRLKAYFTRTPLPNMEIEHHVCIKNCTKNLEEKILGFEGVMKVNTHEWYKEEKIWRNNGRRKK